MGSGADQSDGLLMFDIMYYVLKTDCTIRIFNHTSKYRAADHFHIFYQRSLICNWVVLMQHENAIQVVK